MDLKESKDQGSKKFWDVSGMKVRVPEMEVPSINRFFLSKYVVRSAQHAGLRLAPCVIYNTRLDARLLLTVAINQITDCVHS